MKVPFNMQRTIVIFVGLFFLSSSVSGQNNQFGRLFTTPAERFMLNQARKQKDVEPLTPLEQAPTPDQKTLGGYVIRNGVKTMTWINQIPQEEADQVNNIKLSKKANQTPTFFIKTESGKPIKVDVGDTVDMHTGTVRKVYESLPEPETQPPY